MESSTHFSLVRLDKPHIRRARVFSGISPKAMRRVFGAWLAFVAVVGLLVFLAPGLSITFILTTVAMLIVFTVAMFAQSRIAEGWPAVLVDQDMLYVVRDPYKREFFQLPPSLVTSVESTLIKPNKKAIALLLDTAQLTESDIEMLNQAVWPRDDRLLALAHFISRDKACADISQYISRYRR